VLSVKNAEIQRAKDEQSANKWPILTSFRPAPKDMKNGIKSEQKENKTRREGESKNGIGYQVVSSRFST
jgi:hypothetical protein